MQGGVQLLPTESPPSPVQCGWTGPLAGLRGLGSVGRAVGERELEESKPMRAQRENPRACDKV